MIGNNELESSGINPRSREIAEALLSMRQNPGWLIMLEEIDGLISDCVDQICSLTNENDMKTELIERSIFKIAVRVDDLRWFKARMADLIMQGTTPDERAKITKAI